MGPIRLPIKWGNFQGLFPREQADQGMRRTSHLHTMSRVWEHWNCTRLVYLSAVAVKGTVYSSVSQPPGRGPVPGPGINYTGPREVLLEIVILVF